MRGQRGAETPSEMQVLATALAGLTTMSPVLGPWSLHSPHLPITPPRRAEGSFLSHGCGKAASSCWVTRQWLEDKNTHPRRRTTPRRPSEHTRWRPCLEGCAWAASPGDARSHLPPVPSMGLSKPARLSDLLIKPRARSTCSSLAIQALLRELPEIHSSWSLGEHFSSGTWLHPHYHLKLSQDLLVQGQCMLRSRCVSISTRKHLLPVASDEGEQRSSARRIRCVSNQTLQPHELLSWSRNRLWAPATAQQRLSEDRLSIM